MPYSLSATTVVAATLLLAGCGSSTNQPSSTGRLSSPAIHTATTNVGTAPRPSPQTLNASIACAILPASQASTLIRPYAIEMGGGGLPDGLRVEPQPSVRLNVPGFGNTISYECKYVNANGQWLILTVGRGGPSVSYTLAHRSATAPVLEPFAIDGHTAYYTPGFQGGSLAGVTVELSSTLSADVDPTLGVNSQNPQEPAPEIKPLAKALAAAFVAHAGAGGL